MYKEFFTFLLAGAAFCIFAADRTLEFRPEQFKIRNGAKAEWRNQTLYLKIHNSEQDSGVVILPPEGTKFDFSQAKYLACEVENLSKDHQMRLAMHISSGKRDKRGETHVDVIPPREINSGIGLNPGEKRTLRMFLPHASLYLAPGNGKNMRVLDTARINGIEFLLSWPVEKPRKYLVDCKVTGIRLEEEADFARKITGSENYFPFVDVYGQYIHADWPEKIRRDSDLVDNYRKELAELASTVYPVEWNAYGGWLNGPTLRATGSFRTEKYRGKWYFVDPSGKLFWSTGIDVLLPSTDPVGRDHPEWFSEDVPKVWRLPFNAWNLQKKYGRKDYQGEFFRILARRLPAWGMNTVGCWGAAELMNMGRFPYTVTLGEMMKGFPRFRKQNVKFYDVFDPEFEVRMGNLLRNAANADPFLEKSIHDPMCIGYFIDNELNFRQIIPAVIKAEPDQPAKLEFIRELKRKYSTIDTLNRSWGTAFTDWTALAANRTEPDSEAFRADCEVFQSRFIDRYYEMCRRGIKSAAPHRLYLGSRLASFKQSDDIWKAAAKYCDVISVNTYMDSMANIITEKLHDKPVLIGEFHFGVIDRGMFDGGLCRSADQKARAIAYIRFLQGALVHPNMVGAHWFQFRDQPLTGRWGGEGYAIGFVDVADTPYPELCKAAREVGENMYRYRMNGKYVNNMKSE